MGAPLPVKAVSFQKDPESPGCILSFWSDADPIKNDNPSNREPILQLVLPRVTYIDAYLYEDLPLANVEACIWGFPFGSPRQRCIRMPLNLSTNPKWLRVIGEGGEYPPHLLGLLNYPRDSGPNGSSKLETLIIDSVKFRTRLPWNSHFLACVLPDFPNLKKIEIRNCSNFFAEDFKMLADAKLPVRWDNVVTDEDSESGVAVVGDNRDRKYPWFSL